MSLDFHNLTECNLKHSNKTKKYCTVGVVDQCRNERQITSLDSSQLTQFHIGYSWLDIMM